MKQDRFLTGILIGIAALVLLAVVLFFVRKDGREYMTEDTPKGVVNNYLLAVLDKDYERAYGYMADLDHKPTYQEFRQSFFNGMVNPQDVGVDIGSVQINGDEAYVNLTLYYSNNDPFSSRYTNEDKVLLVNQDSAWKLSSMSNGNYWDYNWYKEIPK